MNNIEESIFNKLRRSKNITLQQLVKMLNAHGYAHISDGSLSRYLRGIDCMPASLESALMSILNDSTYTAESTHR